MANAIKRAILGVVGPKVAQPARVTEVRAISEHFRLIDLEVDQARLAHGGPVDKVKVNTSGWNVRTYTPVLQPHPPGRLRLLVYLHGDGPGARWAGSLGEGDATQIVGPKAALQVGHAPFVLVGDETSFATAMNFHARPDVHAVFETIHPQEAQQVLTALGVRNVSIVPKMQHGAHRAELHRLVRHHMQILQTSQAILTGHAQAIQQVGRALKAEGARPDLQTKPHWADNKQGLD